MPGVEVANNEEEQSAMSVQEQCAMAEGISVETSGQPSAKFEEVLIPTFSQVPWTTLIARMDNGSQGLAELAALLHDKRDSEEKAMAHYVKVSKTDLYEHEIDTSTAERMLGFFKNYHLFLYKSLVQKHRTFVDTLLTELDEAQLQRSLIINRHKVGIQSCLQSIEHAHDALMKAKKHHVKARADFERTADRLSVAEKSVDDFARMVEERKRDAVASREANKWRAMFSAFESTPEQERDKLRKKSDKRYEDMVAAAETIVERRRTYLSWLSHFDEQIQQAKEAFQELETVRMKHVQALMKKFCAMERQSIEFRLQQLTTFEEAVDHQQPDEDIALFISQSKKSEDTHKLAKALSLLEEFLTSRPAEEIPAQEETTASFRGSAYQESSSRSQEQMDSSTHGDKRAHDVNIIVDVTMQVDSDKNDDTASAESPVGLPPQSLSLVHETPLMAELNQKLELIFDSIDLTCNRLSQPSPGDSPSPCSHLSADPIEVVTTAQWMPLLSGRSTRHQFMRVLDLKRADHAALDDSRYHSLVNALEILLNLCEEGYEDLTAASAMRVANMANTFHKCHEEKFYLQSDPRLKTHSIWRQPGFWDSALKEGVFAQLQHAHLPEWDDLSMDHMREVAINIHNIVFGQLGTLSFAMLQHGLSQQEVLDLVARMSRKFELTEEQEFELIMNVTGKRTKEHKPPAVLAVPHIKDVELQVSGNAVVLSHTPPSAAMQPHIVLSSAPSQSMASADADNLNDVTRERSNTNTSSTDAQAAKRLSLFGKLKVSLAEAGIHRPAFGARDVPQSRQSRSDSNRRPSFDDEFAVL